MASKFQLKQIEVVDERLLRCSIDDVKSAVQERFFNAVVIRRHPAGTLYDVHKMHTDPCSTSNQNNQSNQSNRKPCIYMVT